MHLKRGGDGKYICLFTHLDRKISFYSTERNLASKLMRKDRFPIV